MPVQLIVRIPTDQYAYIELHFDTVLEYAEQYPAIAATIAETRFKAKKAIEDYVAKQPF